MSRLRTARGFVLLGIAALVLASCGGNDEEEITPVVTEAPVETPAAEAAATPTVQSAEQADLESATPTDAAATPIVMPIATPAAAQVATPPASSVATHAITLTDFRVNAARVSFTVGETYTFDVLNNGSHPHQFIIERLGEEGAPLSSGTDQARVDVIEPGETARLTWTFEEPGEYQFACHMPGHYEARMYARTITVGA